MISSGATVSPSPDGKNTSTAGAHVSRRNRFGRAMVTSSSYDFCYEHMLITKIQRLPMKIKRQTSGNSQKRIGMIVRSCYTSFGKECIESTREKEFLCGYRFSCDS